MHRRFIARFVLASCCLVSAGFAAEPSAQLPQVEPMSRARAARVFESADTIAENLERQIAASRDPGLAVILDDLRSVMTPPAEWRWYSRDHGILLAISVREQLGIATKAEGEKALADIVRRLINQNGWGNPPVQVVLREPEIVFLKPRPCTMIPVNAAAIPCDCR